MNTFERYFLGVNRWSVDPAGIHVRHHLRQRGAAYSPADPSMGRGGAPHDDLAHFPGLPARCFAMAGFIAMDNLQDAPALARRGAVQALIWLMMMGFFVFMI
jgi:hypothetical protein